MNSCEQGPATVWALVAIYMMACTKQRYMWFFVLCLLAS